MPDWNEPIRRMIAGLRLSPAREAEIVEELAQHAEDRYRELRSEGTAEAEARRRALDETRGLAAELRAIERQDSGEPVVLGMQGPGQFLPGFGQDLRYGFRTLRKNPGFTAVAMLALAVGIGANTAIFSVVNGVLLRPLAYPEPDRLVMDLRDLTGIQPKLGGIPELPRLAPRNPFFHAIWEPGATTTLTSPEPAKPEQLSGKYVSASLFPALGVTPLLGRTFQPQDDRQGAACTVMLS